MPFYELCTQSDIQSIFLLKHFFIFNIHTVVTLFNALLNRPTLENAQSTIRNDGKWSTSIHCDVFFFKLASPIFNEIDAHAFGKWKRYECILFKLNQNHRRTIETICEQNDISLGFTSILLLHHCYQCAIGIGYTQPEWNTYNW